MSEEASSNNNNAIPANVAERPKEKQQSNEGPISKGNRNKGRGADITLNPIALFLKSVIITKS